MPPSALRFGPFVLDLERLCLRGPAGEVELRPKSFEVLRRLAERPRRVVAKEALIGAIWSDVTVTDDSLTRCIGEVRRAIADERGEMLKTVPRRGYMLDLPVTAQHGPGDTRAGEVPLLGTAPSTRGTTLPPRPSSRCCPWPISPAIPLTTPSATALPRTSSRSSPASRSCG